MKRQFVITWLCICLSSRLLAADSDSTVYEALHRLAHQLHLKAPKPRQNEYEVRVWQKEQLVRGAAHKVYVLRKTKRNVRLISYRVNADKWIRQKSARQEYGHSGDSTVWNRLVQLSILTLPDWLIVQKRLPPKPNKDSTRVSLEADGTITVKANKIESGFVVSDGETYYFEVFSANGYRNYHYDNPVVYAGFKPVAELQKVVAILDELSTAFLFKPKP